MKKPSMFKLMQQHINNWDVNKFYFIFLGLPPVDV
jgi:hypothetical protein